MAAAEPLFKEIDSIKGFEYPVACTGVCVSSNQRRIVTLGVYKPAVKLFDLGSMTMKFERHLVADPIQVLSLVDNAEKFVILRKDRTLEFHSRNGLHDTVRMPYQPREMLFNPVCSELYACGAYDTVFRFSLEQGRFLKGIDASNIRGLAFSDRHGLIAGVSAECVHLIDSRSRETVLTRNVPGAALSCIDFSDNAVNYAVATEEGALMGYDIRADAPTHRTSLDGPVGRIKYSGRHLLCSSGSSISVFSEDWKSTRIETEFSINSFDISGGLLAVGGEYEEMRCYFSDRLGPVPSWCSNVVLG